MIEDDLTNEKVSPCTSVVMGLQHLLTMCPAALTLPVILGQGLGLDREAIAFMVSANLLASGIAILIQVYGIGKFAGARMPIVMGPAFAPLGPMIILGNQYGLPILFGAVIGAAIALCLISFFMEWIMKFFPPVVVGTFVMFIGISMAPIAFANIAGGIGSTDFGAPRNILLGLGVMCFVVFLNRYGSQFLQSISLLLGIALGSCLSFFLGMLDVPSMKGTPLIELIEPMRFGTPRFEAISIAIMTLFCVVNMIQSISSMALLDNVFERDTGIHRKGRGIRGQAIAQLFSGFFGAVPSAMFTENVGIIALSKITARSTVGFTGAMLILISLFPKLSVLVTAIPKPVIGGVTLALFGTISAAGVSILSRLDYSDQSNSLILGTGLVLGVGAMFTPGVFSGLPPIAAMLAGNGLFVVCVVAVLSHIVFNMIFKR